MLMKNLLLMLLWAGSGLAFSPAQCQYFYNAWYYNYDLVWEAGISVGLMNCLTDIGGRKGNGKPFAKDIDWRSSSPCFNIHFSATYKDKIAVRFDAYTGLARAGDSVLKTRDPDPSGRYARNLSFRSRIYELQLAAEIHPLFFALNSQDDPPALSPYVLTGISYFHFNPQARLYGRWHDLQPLRTEGQGFAEYKERQPYSLHQWAIPLGLGIRYETGPLLNIRLEIVHRFLFTDYLDDVSTTYIDPAHFLHYLDPEPAALARQLYSRMDEIRQGSIPAPGTQRGNRKNNDAYFSVLLKVGYVFRKRVR
jgi:hypothetical protein